MPEHDAIRERLGASPCFFTDLLAELPLSPEEIQEALWDLVWAGEVTNDAFAPLRAPRLTLARAQRARRPVATPGRRFGARRSGAGATGAGPLVADHARIFSERARPRPAPPHAGRAAARALRHRHARARARRGHRRRLLACSTTRFGALETLGVCRRGYFIEGLGGAQFALPGAVERLRAQQADDEAPPIVLAATDPAQPYGAALPWPKRDGETEAPAARRRRPRRARRQPSRCSTSSAAAAASWCWPSATTRACARASRRSPRSSPRDRRRKLGLERVDGEPVVGSRWEPLLIELGFRQGPRKLTLSA